MLINNAETELIDLITIDNKNKILENLNLNNEDYNFLLSFIEDGKILSQKEVAKKLNITQPAVSKKINKIKK